MEVTDAAATHANFSHNLSTKINARNRGISLNASRNEGKAGKYIVPINQTLSILTYCIYYFI